MTSSAGTLALPAVSSEAGAKLIYPIFDGWHHPTMALSLAHRSVLAGRRPPSCLTASCRTQSGRGGSSCEHCRMSATPVANRCSTMSRSLHQHKAALRPAAGNCNSCSIAADSHQGCAHSVLVNTPCRRQQAVSTYAAAHDTALASDRQAHAPAHAVTTAFVSCRGRTPTRAEINAMKSGHLVNSVSRRCSVFSGLPARKGNSPITCDAM